MQFVDLRRNYFLFNSKKVYSREGWQIISSGVKVYKLIRKIKYFFMNITFEVPFLFFILLTSLFLFLLGFRKDLSIYFILVSLCKPNSPNNTTDLKCRTFAKNGNIPTCAPFNKIDIY